MKAAFLSSAILLASGCSTAESGPPGTEIVTFRVRDGFVEVRTGPEGRRFTVLDGAGRAVAVDLSEDELRARYPGHVEAIDRGIASPDDSIDASARTPAFDASSP